jgi:hypothetical protein
VAVALALNDDDRRLWSETPQTIQERLGAALPAEAVVPGLRLQQGRAEAHGWLGAARISVRDPQGRRALVRDVREAEFLQIRLWQTLQLRIGGEGASALLQCCR